MPDHAYPEKDPSIDVKKDIVSLISDAEIAARYIQYRGTARTKTMALLLAMGDATGSQEFPPENVKRVCAEVDDEIAAMWEVSRKAADFVNEASLQAALLGVKKHLSVVTWMQKLYVYHDVEDFDQLKTKLEPKVEVAK